MLPAVADPTPDGVAALLGTPVGAAAGWAHFIAFDLFVGRWMYLDARERGLHPLADGPGAGADHPAGAARPARPPRLLRAARAARRRAAAGYSTVTDLARLRGLSTSRPSATAAW